MRNLAEVIDNILEIKTPEDFDHASFSAELLRVKNSYLYAAPEVQMMHWNGAATILEQRLGNADAPWKLQIITIWMPVDIANFD